ncbi:MAG: VWA domain-containing protein [Terriglobales bacterium]
MLTHAYIRTAVLALSAMTYLLIGSAVAKDKDDASGVPTYRSTVSEVRITFFATDENNRPLENVTKSDFAIVDNEQVVRNFRSFAHSQETALDVVVLVDLSESVAPRVRGAISDVLQLVAREQSIADDNISVLSFGGTFGTPASLRPAILCSSGCRASDSGSRLLAVKSGGVTPLFDALMFAADFIADHRRPGRNDVRPVLLLFSDGCDTISLHSASEALQAAQGTGALIYSVDMGRTEIPSPGSTFLRRLSEATGGRYFPLALRNSPQENAAAVLNAVLEDLRASYVVTYDLPSYQAGFHSLRLLPTHKLNFTFHSRNGYDYEPGNR